jgi:hypothetical protein
MRMRVLAARAICLVLVLFSSALSAAPLQDGPYVTRQSNGKWIARWVEGDDAAPTVREEAVTMGREIQVPAVGALPAFSVRLRTVPNTAPDEARLPAGAPLFVMADTHGEFSIAVELLRRHNVVGPDLRWAFGKGHLAVLGDMFDRGEHQTEILWLLFKLEAEAKRAGGAVHVLLGNHEALVVSADERYLAPKYLKVRDALKAPTYASLWNANSLLGQWLRARPAVMKVGDYLCLHGGLSREAVDRKLALAELNASARAALGERQSNSFAMGPRGPLWYRGYFPEEARRVGDPVATSEDVDAILGFYSARRIFVGHTRVPTVTPLYDGRVIAVQVYPHLDAATSKPQMQGLLVKGGELFRAHIDGTLESLETKR